MPTQKQLTVFAEVESEQETECVNGVWISLVVGIRESDKRAVMEMRRWKDGWLERVDAVLTERVVESQQMSADFHACERALAAEKLDQECEDLRHG